MNEKIKQHHNIHFLFVLPSRFPTEKAYGVTTEYSAQAVTQKGYKSSVITPFRDFSYRTSNHVNVVGSGLAKVFLNKKIYRYIFLRFNLFLIAYAILIRLNYRSKEYIFWTRDVYLSLLLSIFSNKIVICEVHRTPLGLQSIAFKLLIIKKNVIIAPISNFLEDKVTLNRTRTVIAPMAVTNKDIKFFSTPPLRKKRKIIYVGHFESGGNKLDLRILTLVSQSFKITNPEWIFEVIGISKEQAKQANDDLDLSNLNFLGYLPRSIVMKKLKSASIGIVLYPNLPWFYDSFPIKIVEYSAAGLAIVASDTISHRRILSTKRCIYFKVESVESLSSAIKKMISSKSTRNKLSKNSKLWATQFTYENRVSAVIKTVLKLESKIS